ncbi:hypothetical protein [Colwellia sp. PAMC 20917]|uniref:hypothetical protein n=1 Tax=Colwellia sp. PAMC 20917 TaxID=1816218 RepID=UPI0012F98E15|nr:hypothetical protein [Colwellia sp. PAMC 20917]
MSQNAFIQARIIQEVEIFFRLESISSDSGCESFTLPSKAPALYLAQLLREFI